MKRILTLLLTICLLLCLSVPAMAASPIGEIGLRFGNYSHQKKGSSTEVYYGDDYYQSVKNLEEVPYTFEAWVNINSTVGEGGVILGNDSARAGGRFTFTINKKGYPQLVLKERGQTTHTVTFTGVSVPYYSWVHLVIVFDETNSEFRCYLNGEIKETIAFSAVCAKTGKCQDRCVGIFSLSSASHYPFVLGGDFNYLNPQYFRGSLQDVALYSDVLSESEILSSYQNGVDVSDENLILFYDIDASDKLKDIEDLSGNGYHLVSGKAWLTEAEMQAERAKKGFVGKYDYSVAVIGDPQYATKSYPEAVRAAYTWLAENKDDKNIQYVIELGDITDQCQESEWLEAAEALRILENAGLYYSLVRGNHDTALSGIDESSKATAAPELYDELFAAEDGFYMSQFLEHGGLYEEGSVKNTYRTLDFEGNKWLILNLDWTVDNSILAWARGVLEDYPEHRAIIVTHDYLGGTGNRSTNGDKIWNNLASLYENVVLVLGGHNSWDNINVLKSEGVHGNTVTQMLIDPQRSDYLLSGVGLVTMFYFSENGSLVDVEYYSPEWDRYYKNINQMQIDLESERFTDTVRPKDDSDTEPPIEDAPPSSDAASGQAPEQIPDDTAGEGSDDIEERGNKNVIIILIVSISLVAPSVSVIAISIFAVRKKRRLR